MSTPGDKGEKGDQGERGQRGRRGEGMAPGTRRAVVMLFALTLLLSGASILFTVSYYHRSEAAQQRQAAAEQAAQRRQGELLEAKLCTSLDALAALAPPGGPPGDLSRKYLEDQHQVLAGLGPDVGCGTRRP